MAKIRHFFCAFLRATGVLVFFCRCVWVGCGGRGRCVVVVGGFVFCVMWWGRADFRGIGCRRVRDDGAVGCSVVIVLWV